MHEQRLARTKITNLIGGRAEQEKPKDREKFPGNRRHLILPVETRTQK
jgi:hypothetical protein